MRQLKINLPKCDGGRHCDHECEEACATKVFKLAGKDGAALHIEALADGQNAAVICDQCGDCVTVCPADALKRNKNGVVMIDKKLCVGCYMCIGFCEQEAFMRNPEWLEPYKCTACGICVKACPHAALEIVDVPTPAPRII
jgi:anaerobic carbon-monoxide dehydrogenase iron sulfur subunit